MEEYESQLNMICAAVDDYRAGKLSPAATITVIGIVMNPQEIDDAAKQWAIEQAQKRGEIGGN